MMPIKMGKRDEPYSIFCASGHKITTMKVTRASDGAEAYRLRIQGDWRLHYWLKPDGSIELANIECGHALHIES